MDKITELLDHPGRVDPHLPPADVVPDRRQEGLAALSAPKLDLEHSGHDELLGTTVRSATAEAVIPLSQMSPSDFFPSNLRLLSAIELAVFHSRAQRAVDAALDHGDLDQEISFRLEEIREELDRRDTDSAHESPPPARGGSSSSGGVIPTQSE